MDLQLAGKRALVTGSSSGIGRGVALVLAHEGATVVVHGRNRDRSEETAAAIRAAGGTAHLAIGADIGHFHASADGAALGATSHTDFRIFCSVVRALNGGGVYLNLGSAVMMPEIFLKAVTVVRNLGFELQDFTTANFDFIQHYRPLTNVVRRPTANGAGRGFSITGHHEIMIPLLAAQIFCGE